MADRRMEFMEKVKFALDKSEARRDAEEFAKEIQGMFSDTKIGFDSNSLKQLGELFNEKLKEFGKKPIMFSDIDISDNALKEITTRFTNAIAEGIQVGIKEGIAKTVKVSGIDFSFDDQLKKLKTDRQKLVEEYHKTEKLIKNKTKIGKINNVLGENKRLTLTGDLSGNTDAFIKNFNEAVKRMESAKKGTSEYTNAVLEAQSALDNLYALQSEWEKKRNDLSKKNKELKDVIWAKPTPENAAKEKQLSEEIKQLKGMNIESQINKLTKLKNSDIADVVKTAFGDISVELDNASKKLQTIQTQIIEIDKQINELENNSGILKALDEVEKAYDRILNKKSKTVNKTKREGIESALNYGETGERTTLAKLAHGYEKSNLSGFQYSFL